MVWFKNKNRSQSSSLPFKCLTCVGIFCRILTLNDKYGGKMEILEAHYWCKISHGDDKLKLLKWESINSHLFLLLD